ncbi:MAG: tetratricopeptide repeat protein [Chloroflexota bacterium]|nr:tetratricopeptide repeat protein [Chloroflexota bacterium]
MRASLYRSVVLSLLLTCALGGFLATGRLSYGTAGQPPGEAAISATSGEDQAARTGAGLVARPPARGPALARAEFDRMLVEHPNDPSSLLILAAEIQRYDVEDGEQTLKLLTQAYPRSALIWTALADVLYEQGDLKESRAALQQARQLHPELPEGLLLRGKLLATDGPDGVDRALREWRRVIELAPASPAAREAARLTQLYEGR